MTIWRINLIVGAIVAIILIAASCCEKPVKKPKPMVDDRTEAERFQDAIDNLEKQRGY